jgi:hypothetical protein
VNEIKDDLSKFYWKRTRKLERNKASISANTEDNRNPDPYKEADKLFVRITDNAGNTTYPNSNSVQLYADVVVEVDHTLCTKDSFENVNTQVNFMGNTINSVGINSNSKLKLTSDDYKQEIEHYF